MKFKLEPAKNQKFDIGRTINLAKCDCKKCDFMHCPKNNYALKMVQHKYTIKEFFEENKTEIMRHNRLVSYLDYDTITDFFDACVSGFPKGTYWRLDSGDYPLEIYLCTQNRSRYGEDFINKAGISVGSVPFTVSCYAYCTDTQERLAEKIASLLNELNELFKKEKSKEHL